MLLSLLHVFPCLSLKRLADKATWNSISFSFLKRLRSNIFLGLYNNIFQPEALGDFSVSNNKQKEAQMFIVNKLNATMFFRYLFNFGCQIRRIAKIQTYHVNILQQEYTVIWFFFVSWKKPRSIRKTWKVKTSNFSSALLAVCKYFVIFFIYQKRYLSYWLLFFKTSVIVSAKIETTDPLQKIAKSNRSIAKNIHTVYSFLITKKWKW